MNKKLRLKLRLRNYNLSILSRILVGRIYDRTGITNICKDNMRCNFIDFATDALINEYKDKIRNINSSTWCLTRINESCFLNQMRFQLGDYFIVQSYPRLSYHAFCLDKISLEMDRTILANTKYVDLMYVETYSERFKGYLPHTPTHKVLRYIEKSDTYPDEHLEICDIVPNFSSNKKSRMHNIFFNLRYGIPLYKDEYLDDSRLEQIKYEKYESLR